MFWKWRRYLDIGNPLVLESWQDKGPRAASEHVIVYFLQPNSL